MRSISILGATGSIGASTLDLIRRNSANWRVLALSAHSNAVELAKLAREFAAEIAVVAVETKLPELREALSGTNIQALGGPSGLVEAASAGADMTIAAIVGCAGLAPTMAAIVGNRSIEAATCWHTRPAAIRAGQRMIAGTRMPPSSVLAFPLRSGSAVPA